MIDEDNIREKLKNMIVRRLELKISPNAIMDNAPLFKDGLGLDSVEALEIVVGIEEEFGVLIEETDNMKEKFASIRALAAFTKELLEENKVKS